MKITDLTITNSEINFELKLDKDKKLVSEFFLINEEVSSYLVYVTLKDSIGGPNLWPLDHNGIQWSFEVIYNDFCFRISDWQSRTWMISCYAKAGTESKDAKKTTETLEKAIINATNKFKKNEDEQLKQKKERFIENPFKTYYDAAIVLLDEARKIDPSNAENVEDSNLLLNLVSTLCKASFTSFLSSFEGCLNLLYEIYLNKSLREPRISDRISREQVDVKFRLAPFYCEGFSVKTLDSTDSRFKNFLKLVNLRNDFVHANITESMQQAIVRDGDFSFILNKKHSGELPNNINQLNIHHIELTNQYIDEAITLLIESMETRTEREFRKIIIERHIQVEEVNGLVLPII